MYRLFAKLYPYKLKKNYERLLKYANIKSEPSKFLGFILFFGIGLALFLAFDIAALFKTTLWLTFLICFLIIEFLFYFYLLMHADIKARLVEDSLPDALQLMSSNLRAGLTTDRALLLSARPEFGPLQEEINLVGKEITIGKQIDQALINMSSRIKSEKLEKSVLLIVSGLRSGGELASLLEETAENLRQQKLTEQKVRSSVLMYVIFIFAAVGVGSPILFGLSTFLVQLLNSILSTIEIPEAALSIPFSITKVSIKPEFIIRFAIISLISSSIFASIIIGLISKGKEKNGVKYIPLLILLSLLIFFLIRLVAGGMLSDIFSL